MRCHYTSLYQRLVSVARRSPCNYRVAAAGVDYRGRIISIVSNKHRSTPFSDSLTRGWHAEERLLHSSPKSLRKIIILRIGHSGNLLPIDPCKHCLKLAKKYGVAIESIQKKGSS